MNVSEWIEWKGGEIPVALGTEVEIRYRDVAGESKLLAENVNWQATRSAFSVVAYRIVKEKEE